MITRVEAGQTYTQTFDAENRLISVTVSGQTTQFIYDGDGNLVKKIKPDGSKTLYVGGIYEVDKASGGSVTRTVTYYPVAGAMRINSTLYYILKDHLGSASVVTDASGTILGTQRYYPFGETRLTTGTIYTDKLFTGQREITGLGIYHYQARFYSPKLGRFLSADTIVPGYGNPQNLNRFSYVLNNPLRYIDPTGHVCSDPENTNSNAGCSSGGHFVTKKYLEKHSVSYKIRYTFKNVSIRNLRNWELRDLKEIYTGLTEISGNGFNGNTDAFSAAFGAVTFVPVPSGFLGDYVGDAVWQTGRIRLEPKAVWETVVHEMGHILDGSLKRINRHLPLRSNTVGDPFDTRGRTTDRGRANSVEDFADSFLAVIKYGPQTDRVDEPRVAAILALIQSYTDSNQTISPGR
jgi:RHS repeat-associated protein